MEYRQLGRSGLQVSVISLGTNQFGTPVDADGVQSIMDAGLDAGINFVDTADGYGGGLSEQYIGRAIKDRRYDWVVMTKFGNYPMGEGPNKRGNSRGYMRQALAGQLQRLDTDYLDVYLFHRPDARTPLEEQMSAMNDLVREGLVRYIG